jgi:CheY-like chemotaxis protein
MKRILLIEDNEDIRENAAEILKLANYQVVTAANGKLGIELAVQLKPNLIICDVIMPELDGYGVLLYLNEHPELQHVPFIFLTGESNNAAIKKGIEMGADEYITKPFDDVELLQVVKKRLHA